MRINKDIIICILVATLGYGSAWVVGQSLMTTDEFSYATVRCDDGIYRDVDIKHLQYREHRGWTVITDVNSVYTSRKNDVRLHK